MEPQDGVTVSKAQIYPILRSVWLIFFVNQHSIFAARMRTIATKHLPSVQTHHQEASHARAFLVTLGMELQEIVSVSHDIPCPVLLICVCLFSLLIRH